MASFLGVRVPFTADGTAFKRGLNNMRKDSEGFAGSLKSMFKDAFSVAGGIGIASGVGKLIDGIKSLGTQAVKGAADMESLQIAFEVMLGSAKDAKKLLADLAAYAEQTPLTLSDLTQGTKTLMQFGVSLDDVLPTLKMLGEVSAGDAQKLQSLTVAFGQISSAGRLQGQDLLQLINVGFNPLQEISKKTGESMMELKKRMESGGIGIDEVKGAFVAATSEGGRFFGMLERQSKTTNGLLSTLKDAWEKILRTIGTPINDWLKPMLVGWIEKLSSFASALGEAVAGGRVGELLAAHIDVAVEAFKDGMGAVIEWAGQKLSQVFREVSDAAIRLLPGGEEIIAKRDASEASLKATLEKESAKRKKKEEIEAEIARRNSRGGGSFDTSTAIGRLEKLKSELAFAAEVKEAKAAEADAAAAVSGEDTKKGNKGFSGQLADAIKSAFGIQMSSAGFESYGFKAGKLAKPKAPGEIPSIIASELATMGLGGRAAGFGGFDPLVEQMKSSVDYQRRMAEYLQQIASKSGAYEPVA